MTGHVARLLRTDLVGIAEMSNEHEALYVDDGGSCYRRSGQMTRECIAGVESAAELQGHLCGGRQSTIRKKGAHNVARSDVSSRSHHEEKHYGQVPLRSALHRRGHQ